SPSLYNPLFLYPNLNYFPSPPATSTHRPMDRRAPNGRRERMTYDRNQLKTLEDVFKSTPYPDASKREQLAKILHLEETRVQVWFKNRRAKQRSQTKGTPGGREDGGSSSVSPKDQQPRFKPVSELPFIPMPTPPKEEEMEMKVDTSAFSSIKKEDEINTLPPAIPSNMEVNWSNYWQMFPQMNSYYPQVDYSNFMNGHPPNGWSYPGYNI
ncbi:hypothetical protein PMAYCL1PPCAC_02156, partial [Pristionchus mayeri]